jgi:dolichol-phosphate mannosyltransferase
MTAFIRNLSRQPRFGQFIKFCAVGGSGVAVDMVVLHFLADPRWCGWNLTISKFCSAETAMLSNFILNELWTFRPPAGQAGHAGWGVRLLKFHAICGLGIVWAILLLHLFYERFGCNLYLANLLSIGLVTLWNFGLNVTLNWGAKAKTL